VAVYPAKRRLVPMPRGVIETTQPEAPLLLLRLDRADSARPGRAWRTHLRAALAPRMRQGCSAFAILAPPVCQCSRALRCR
jgi:hypothetical protein